MSVTTLPSTQATADSTERVSWARYSEFLGTDYFPGIDGLRAVSVLLVMCNHVAHPPSLTGWIKGWTGVHVFFVISGFLITTLLLREEERNGRVSLRNFYLRRVFRILPVYFAVLSLYLLICHTPMGAAKWAQLREGLPYYLSFLQEYRPDSVGTVFGHSWSLGVEEKFYLVWPFLFFVVLLRWRGSLARLLPISAVMVALAVFGSHNLCRSYFGIAVGCTLAVVMHVPRTQNFVLKLAAVPTPLVIASVATTYLLICAIGDAAVLLFDFAIALLIVHLLINRGLTRSAMSHPAMIWLGKRSYSMYLVHVLCINAVEKVIHPSGAFGFAVVIAVSYAITALFSHLLYVVIERNCISYGRKLTAKARAI